MKTTLGLVDLPESKVKPDFDVQDRYQGFSAEILRLALLGISGIGVIALKYIFPEGDSWQEAMPTPALVSLSLSLACLGLTSVTALAHRYVSVDSLSWHVQALRREIRNTEQDIAQLEHDRQMRYRRFLQSRRLVLASAIGLAVGAICLALAFAFLAIPVELFC